MISLLSIILGTFKNSDFFLNSTMHRADDYMDARDSATQEAKAQNRSRRALWVLQRVSEGLSTALTTSWIKAIGRRSKTRSRSGEKRIFRAALLTIILSPIVVHADEASALRDPTTPVGFKAKIKEGATPLNLQAIFDRGGTRSAIISGVNVKEGGWVAGALVLRILEKKVYMRREGKVEVLTLRPSIR